ncbi:hypothetical protein GCM10010271_55590 [Streptomyces kurssanovii]|nr:hypothetical protein GCM10010271_55590 [Streptomyces kurssanovii]
MANAASALGCRRVEDRQAAAQAAALPSPVSFIDSSSTRCEQIASALERITDQYVRGHGRLPDERARHALGRRAAQGTRLPSPDSQCSEPVKSEQSPCQQKPFQEIEKGGVGQMKLATPPLVQESADKVLSSSW